MMHGPWRANFERSTNCKSRHRGTPPLETPPAEVSAATPPVPAEAAPLDPLLGTSIVITALQPVLPEAVRNSGVSPGAPVRPAASM